MSESQLIEIVRLVSDNLTSRLWLLVVGQLVVAGLAAFFGSYLAQKAKNRADREDIRKLTETVEDVKRLSLVQSKTHEKVRERQIEALRSLYCELSRLEEFAKQRAKMFRFDGEDDRTNMTVFWKQYDKTVDEFIHHSLLIRDDLNSKIRKLLTDVMVAGAAMDLTDVQPKGPEAGTMKRSDFDFAFKTLPDLLKEIRAESKDVLRSEQVEL